MKKLALFAFAAAMMLGTAFCAFADGLTSLSVTTMDNKICSQPFAPSVHNYYVQVQSDIYGVLLKAEGTGTIEVTADKDTFAYGSTTPSYKAGSPIAYDEKNGGYIIPLDQSYKGYNSTFVQTATVNAGGQKYKVKITRADDTATYKLFKQNVFKAADGTELDYNLYVPKNYNPAVKYPVVLALHGSGQKTQPVDMILKRYQMATVFAKDSENDGSRECIVIAPQAKKNWAVEAPGASVTFSTGALSPEGQAAYELLQYIKGKYSIDSSREYITGLSMGAIGSITMIYNYPNEFAAAYLVAARYGYYDYSKFLPMSGRIRFVIAEDDPTVLYKDAKVLMDGWKNAGVQFDTTIYPAGTFFYPSAHFSWVPAYNDRANLAWMFAMSR